MHKWFSDIQTLPSKPADMINMLENNIYFRAHMLIMSICALGCGWYIFQSSHDIVVVRPHRQRIERITSLAGSQQGGPWPSQPACYQVNPINQSALKVGKRQDERVCRNNFFGGEKVLFCQVGECIFENSSINQSELKLGKGQDERQWFLPQVVFQIPFA